MLSPHYRLSGCDVIIQYVLNLFSPGTQSVKILVSLGEILIQGAER